MLGNPFDVNDLAAATKRLNMRNLGGTSLLGGPGMNPLGGQTPIQLSHQVHMTIDQQLQLMNVVNNMVKNGQFTTQLANTIFTLCQQLKVSGMMLEQSHKAELNKVFVSLRQACCRDNGQLGTPCRLKIMELVELRAMHWRTNLAHSQYYVNRPEQQESPTVPQPSTPQMNFMHQSLFMPSDMSSMSNMGNMGNMASAAAHQTSPYFLIPAAMPGGFMNPLLPGLMQQQLFAPQMNTTESVLMRNKSITKKVNFPMAPKPLQLRHEMVIRNADSGKIMGVKGRRVALVEQITNTVISFQKVDPKSRERTLTITASSMEAIEHAKQLIDETIRRNMSPSRPEHLPENGGLDDDGDDDYEDENDNNDISIETSQDGVLKLCCSDPQVLQAAQAALSEYLRVRARPSAEEREKKKERRKSMPLQPTAQKEAPVREFHPLERARSLGGSTPNLQEAKAAAAAAAARVPAPFGPCYGREALLAQRQSSSVIDVDAIKKQIAAVAPQILLDAAEA